MDARHADGDWTVSARAATLHREAPIIDEPGADAAVEIRRTLERHEVGIGGVDSLVARIVGPTTASS